MIYYKDEKALLSLKNEITYLQKLSDKPQMKVKVFVRNVYYK